MSKKTILILFITTALILILGLFYLVWWLSPEIKKLATQTTVHEAVINWSDTNSRLTPESPEATVIAVGDIMLSRVVEQKMLAHKDFNYPFIAMNEYLKTADLAFGNLETAITPGAIVKTGGMAFRADPKVAQILWDNNFKILSLANNHTPNFGATGLKDTFDYLTTARIKYIGAGENLSRAREAQYLEVDGIKIAWLARTEQLMVPENYAAGEKSSGTAFWDQEEIVTAIKSAKERADLVFVSMHAGVEYTPEPTKEQTAFARAAADAGAEMVIGHHPHVVQTAEKHQGKYIFYSLGNFIFDQMWSRETREGIALKISLTKAGVKQIIATPILIEDYCQPRIIDGEEGEKIVKRLGLEVKKNGDAEYLLN